MCLRSGNVSTQTLKHCHSCLGEYFKLLRSVVNNTYIPSSQNSLGLNIPWMYLENLNKFNFPSSIDSRSTNTFYFYHFYKFLTTKILNLKVISNCKYLLNKTLTLQNVKIEILQQNWSEFTVWRIVLFCRLENILFSIPCWHCYH